MLVISLDQSTAIWQIHSFVEGETFCLENQYFLKHLLHMWLCATTRQIMVLRKQDHSQVGKTIINV